MASTLGQTGNPFESWMAMRGLSTLALRMGRACATALACRNGSRRTRRSLGYTTRSCPHARFDRASQLLGNGGGTIVTIELSTRARAEAFIRALAPGIPFPRAWATSRRP